MQNNAMATKHRLIYFENRKIFCSKEIKDKTLGDREKET